MKTLSLLAAATLALALAAGAGAASLSDQENCGVKKARALFKYGKCLDKAYDKYYSSDDLFPSTAQLTKCDEKCERSMAAAETNEACANLGAADNPEICGPASFMDDEADCRYKALHFGTCTYPPAGD